MTKLIDGLNDSDAVESTAFEIDNVRYKGLAVVDWIDEFRQVCCLSLKDNAGNVITDGPTSIHEAESMVTHMGIMDDDIREISEDEYNRKQVSMGFCKQEAMDKYLRRLAIPQEEQREYGWIKFGSRAAVPPNSSPGFTTVNLNEHHRIYRGQLPTELLPDADLFETLWNLHPDHFESFNSPSGVVELPRWQQAYNRNYRFSGKEAEAVAIPEILIPFWDWAKQAIDDRLNGIMTIWYDGQLGHYIGKHRDSIDGLVKDSSIVTISLGESRSFRLRPFKGRGFQDYPIDAGTVYILPWNTNQAFTHEVTKSKRDKGRRISITLRAFEDDGKGAKS